MKIREIDNCADLLSLRKRWNDTLEKCDHTVFSTWEWLTCWWRHFGCDKKLVLLLAEEDEEIVGMAPLMYSVHKMFGARMGKIEFIGTPDSDYHDFVLGERGEECVELFIDHLQNIAEKWGFIELTEFPENAKCPSYLRKFSNDVKPVHECPYTPLPESYEEFLMSLSRNQRKNIYRTSRRLAELFKVDFTGHSDPHSFYEGMQCLFDLHQKRWESRRFPGIFADERYRAFNIDIARNFSVRDWLCLYVMRLSGKAVAAAYGFKYNSKFYEYITGLDPTYAKFNVGNLLRSYMIEKLIEKGITEFDFMRGAEEYKSRWNTKVRWNQKVVLTRKGSFPTIRKWFYNEYWRQGSRLKYVVKNAPRNLAHALHND